MINKKRFNSEIKCILNERNIEGILLANVDIIEKVIDDKNINSKLYQNFCDEYENIYGKDVSNIFMKIQDMVYRLNILINNTLINNYDMSNEEILNFIDKNINKDLDLFSAVNYDEYDRDIIEENNLIAYEYFERRI